MIAVLAFFRRIPWQVYVIVALLSITAVLRWHWIGVGVERCQSAQEAAESRADAKAIKSAGRAQAKAQEASATISKETHDAAAEVRVILRDRACPAGAELPPRVHELGEQAVERARRALRPAEG